MSSANRNSFTTPPVWMPYLFVFVFLALMPLVESQHNGEHKWQQRCMFGEDAPFFSIFILPDRWNVDVTIGTGMAVTILDFEANLGPELSP